jgi:hypothetical protein
MTLTDWRNDATLAAELKQILANPTLQTALSILELQTMARTLGTGNGMLQLSDKAHVLFGYDAGRASFVSDLHNLTIVSEEIVQAEPSYIG